MTCRSAQKIKNRLENRGEVEDVEEMGIVRGVGISFFFGRGTESEKDKGTNVTMTRRNHKYGDMETGKEYSLASFT